MQLKTVDELEALVGERPLPVLMKSIDFLDAHCVQLLVHSPFGVFGYAKVDGSAAALTIGHVTVDDEKHLHFDITENLSLDVNIGVSFVFLIPGLGETLRVNGRAAIDGKTVRVTVEEAFVHCAKSILRSKLWNTSGERTPEEVTWREFLERSPFIVLTSWNASGAADASPKGDPVGFLRFDSQGRVAIADRPGNRRTDTFHNLLEQPRVAMIALVPGDDRIAVLSGRASLTTEPSLLATMIVENKTPKLALLLDVESAHVVKSTASVLWDAKNHVPKERLPKMSDVFIDHVKQNKQRGLAASAVRTLATKTVMAWGLAQDYEKNRY